MSDLSNKSNPHAISRRRFTQAAALGAGSVLFAPALLRAQGTGVIKITNVQGITGPSAAYGIRARDGGLLALDDINKLGFKDASGKSYTFEMTTADMANDPRQAVTLFRQAAGDASVTAVIGPSNSVGFIAMVPVAAQLKMPMVDAGSGAPVKEKEWSPYACRVNPVSTTAIPVVLKKVVAKHGLKRIAVIYDQTQDAQAGDAEVVKTMAASLGYTVVAFEAFRTGDQDFSAQISKIRSTKPDGIYIAATTGDGVKVASQVVEANIKLPMMTGFGSFQDPVYWDGTKGDIKGGYTFLAQDLQAPTPELKSFLDRYKARFTQYEATSFSTYGYDAVYTLYAAIKKAGSLERDKIAAALASLKIVTPLGTNVTFNNPPDGNNNSPSVVVIQVNGRGTYDVVP
jgi:branched-chain amino acid transport system substrate-binding protein